MEETQERAGQEQQEAVTPQALPHLVPGGPPSVITEEEEEHEPPPKKARKESEPEGAEQGGRTGGQQRRDSPGLCSREEEALMYRLTSEGEYKRSNIAVEMHFLSQQPAAAIDYRQRWLRNPNVARSFLNPEDPWHAPFLELVESARDLRAQWPNSTYWWQAHTISMPTYVQRQMAVTAGGGGRTAQRQQRRQQQRQKQERQPPTAR